MASSTYSIEWKHIKTWVPVKLDTLCFQHPVSIHHPCFPVFSYNSTMHETAKTYLILILVGIIKRDFDCVLSFRANADLFIEKPHVNQSSSFFSFYIMRQTNIHFHVGTTIITVVRIFTFYECLILNIYGKFQPVNVTVWSNTYLINQQK